VHYGKVKSGSIKLQESVELKIDVERRDNTRAYHSATHLLHESLRRVLGTHVTQKGSLVEPSRLRFDFSHMKPILNEEIDKIEEFVNKMVSKKSEVKTRLMTPDEAVENGALALFGEKYGDEVRVLSMGDEDGKYFSTELCGGTHVKNTGDIGKFKIVSQSSIAAGVRRIEALRDKQLEEYLKNKEKLSNLSAEKDEETIKDLSQNIIKDEEINGVKLRLQKIDGLPPKELRKLVDKGKKDLGEGIVVVFANKDDKVGLAVGVTDNLTSKFDAVQFVKVGSEIIGGKGGGGRKDFAQAGGQDQSKIEEAFEKLKGLV
jgi:alanyl-tRNA synthetase